MTFKKDTTDASKYDATTLAKVSWSGVDTKKVKATFSLTPTSENVILTTTTQEVEIEIAKIKLVNKQNAFGEGLKNINNGSIQPDATETGKKNPTFIFSNPVSMDNEKITVKTLGTEDIGKFNRSSFKLEFNTKGESFGNEYFSKVEIIDDGVIDKTSNKIATFKLQFTLKPAADYTELELGDGSYSLVADLANYTGNWE